MSIYCEILVTFFKQRMYAYFTLSIHHALKNNLLIQQCQNGDHVKIWGTRSISVTDKTLTVRYSMKADHHNISNCR
jgi:hypothetical protein